MGQAKRRGNFEERKAQAIARIEAEEHRERVCNPVRPAARRHSGLSGVAMSIMLAGAMVAMAEPSSNRRSRRGR